MVYGGRQLGKSTLLKLMAEETEPTEGQVKGGASIEMGYFSQNSLDILDPAVTVLETVTAALPLMNDAQIRTLLGCFLFSGDTEKASNIEKVGVLTRVVRFERLDDGRLNIVDPLALVAQLFGGRGGLPEALPEPFAGYH